MVDAGGFDALVAAASAGDDGALTALYRELHPAVLTVLWAMAPSEAEDLAAETWLHVARYLPSFTGTWEEFRRLVFTVARRRAIDFGRKRRNRRTEPADPFVLDDHRVDVDPLDVVAADDAARQAVRRIFSLLPRAQAEVVVLRVVAGLSVGEVAEVVGRSPAAVSVLQSRGLQRLALRIPDPAKPRPTAER